MFAFLSSTVPSRIKITRQILSMHLHPLPIGWCPLFIWNYALLFATEENPFKKISNNFRGSDPFCYAVVARRIYWWSSSLQVQTRQWACNNAKSVTCNCGVILRDHNDLIKFSCCNPSLTRDDTTPIQVTIPRSKCLAPGISLKQVIKGFNSKYEVSALNFS